MFRHFESTPNSISSMKL